MITLNLVKPEKSDIKYKINRFPDGQQSLDITQYPADPYDTKVKLGTRLNNFGDLEILICAVAALRNMEPDVEITLFIPYFLGARSDRKFQMGGVNYLKQVICPIINSLNLKSIITIDPHSDVLEACLNNFRGLANFKLVDDALSYLIGEDEEDRIVLVSPDAGAYKKVFDVAKEFGINNVITATKVRDLSTGQIVKTELPSISQYGENHKFVIVDDICDGGRTFIELAKEIRKHNAISEIHLVVTHGIFSSGYAELGNYFTNIFTTNSVKEIVNDPEDTDLEREMKAKVKQLNVF